MCSDDGNEWLRQEDTAIIQLAVLFDTVHTKESHENFGPYSRTELLAEIRGSRHNIINRKFKLLPLNKYMQLSLFLSVIFISFLFLIWVVL